MNQLSTILKTARENKGFTQQELADSLGIERKTYSTYETGRSEPELSLLGKLMKILGIKDQVTAILMEQNVPSAAPDIPEDMPLGQMLVSLMKQQSSLMATQNELMQEHRRDVKVRIEEIDSNLRLLLGKAESSQFDLISGREVVLQSLARLEKKDEDSLLSLADKRKRDLAVIKNERYKRS